MNSLSRFRYPLALIFAGLCVAGSIYLTKYYFDARERELRERIRQESRLTDVVVATRDLAPGERIDLDSMSIKSIPFEFVPDGAVRPEQYAEFEYKFLSDPVSAGKPLLRYLVEGVSRVEKFSDILAVGERAITLEVDGVTSIEHMMEAGDYIDLGVRSDKSRSFELLLERIRVLSTGNFTVSEPKVPGMYKSAQYSTITLGVDGRYVQDIYEAESNGDLVFLLRNEKDEASPRYELTAHTKQEVRVYSGGEAEQGVLTASIERVDSSASNSKYEKYERNAKGRVIRLAVDEARPNEFEGKESSSDALTSIN